MYISYFASIVSKKFDCDIRIPDIDQHNSHSLVMKIKICTDVIISGHIDNDIYRRFVHQLRQTIDSRDQGDYSDLFTLSNGQSILIASKKWIHGTVEDVVNWLRLIDIFVLRPHGRYLVDQQLNFKESFGPVVVTLTTINGNLLTKFPKDSDDVKTEISCVPQEMWISVISKLTGQNVTTHTYMEDTENSGGMILKFFSPVHPKGFTFIDYSGDQLKYYKPGFDLETFMDPVDINLTLKRLQYKNSSV